MASNLNFSAPLEPVHTDIHRHKYVRGLHLFNLCSVVETSSLHSLCVLLGRRVCTNLCVQTEHTDFSSVDDLSHRVCARPVQILLKLTRLDQLPWEKQHVSVLLRHSYTLFRTLDVLLVILEDHFLILD